MSGSGTGLLCVNDAMQRVMKIPDFAEKCVFVLSEEDLLVLLKGAKFPMAGVVYGGITRNAGDPSRQGLAADVSVTVLVIVQGNAIGALDEKSTAMGYLDAIRQQFRSYAQSPTGHKWAFVREAPAITIGNALIFKQTWQTPIILT